MQETISKGLLLSYRQKENRVTVHGVALNVTKLRQDIIDPRKYMSRLEQWKTRVETGGGTWQVINDLERLDRILEE